eukprot:gnl/Carplike_NY0171/710_a980_1986.p1 GENE.gnl/Carplike_NY0171/710_a980_1986~~gnl/Carplike_NY0171/710_a980_1986.p1  ORF type:complete len:517 (-),score=167.74 gnl/Carplike_NY0171/710_a980_1986:46-1596(-)
MSDPVQSTSTQPTQPAIIDPKPEIVAEMISTTQVGTAESKKEVEENPTIPEQKITIEAEKKVIDDDDEEESEDLDQVQELYFAREKLDETTTFRLLDEEGKISAPVSDVEWASFKLKESLIRGISDVKYEKPSSIQALVIPILTAGDHPNLVAQSMSGTGKTGAFVLSLLQRVDESINDVQVVVMANTRELVNQIYSVTKVLAKYTKIKVHKGVPGFEVTGKLTKQVLIATPGTLDHYFKKHFITADHMKMFIVDEADELYKNKRMVKKMSRLRKQFPTNVQRVLISATFPDSVREVISKDLPVCRSILADDPKRVVTDCVRHVEIRVGHEAMKKETLADMYKLATVAQSIIFCNTKKKVVEVGEFMRGRSFDTTIFSGDLEDADRDREMLAFRTGETKVLISSDVLSRGIDVPQVNLVINYDIPRGFDEDTPYTELYVHRVGRCGRFGEMGLAVNITCDDNEHKRLDDIKKTLGIDIKKVSSIEELLKALGRMKEEQKKIVDMSKTADDVDDMFS